MYFYLIKIHAAKCTVLYMSKESLVTTVHSKKDMWLLDGQWAIFDEDYTDTIWMTQCSVHQSSFTWQFRGNGMESHIRWYTARSARFLHSSQTTKQFRRHLIHWYLFRHFCELPLSHKWTNFRDWGKCPFLGCDAGIGTGTLVTCIHLGND